MQCLEPADSSAHDPPNVVRHDDRVGGPAHLIAAVPVSANSAPRLSQLEGSCHTLMVHLGSNEQCRATCAAACTPGQPRVTLGSGG
jgi:hypothetical protein